jgi:hypothetical protein
MLAKHLPFVTVVRDYCKTLTFPEFLFDWAAAVGAAAIIVSRAPTSIENFVQFNASAINLLAILVGFSITSITIFSANEGSAVSSLRSHYSDRMIDGNKVTLFQLLHLTLTYGLVIELATLIAALAFCYLIGFEGPTDRTRIFYAVDSLLIVHVLALNLRNVARIYFVFWRQPTTPR